MMRLDHVNVRVDDLERARDFLLEVLPDLAEGFRPPFGFPGYWLYLGDQPVIHLGRPDGEAEATGRGWIDHLAFAAFDFEATRTRLEKAGIDYIVAGIPGTGIRQIFALGPEGLKIELQCPDPAA